MWTASRLILSVAIIELTLAYLVIVFLWWPWPLLIAVVAVGRACQLRKSLWSHGTAEWATCRDLIRARMLFVERGLCIGRLVETEPLGWLSCLGAVFDGRLSSRDACIWAMARLRKLKNTSIGEEVRLNKTPHTLIVSPTGLGKTSALVIEQVRESENESLVILDYKGEISTLTAEHLNKKGYRVVDLDPYELITDYPDSFNPLDFFHKDSTHLIDLCRYIAEQLIVRDPHEREKHFSDAAEMWLTAAILATVLFAPSHRRSLQNVREILSDVTKLPQMIDSLERAGGMYARIGRQLRHFQDKELASTLTTVNRHLRFLDSAAMAESTSYSSFDPRKLRHGKMAIFCTIAPKYVHIASPLLRLWIGSLIMAVMDEGLTQTGCVKFILDEAASLGEMRCIDEAIQKGRGYGVNLQLFYQSTAQLKLCFPLGQDENVLANVTQVYFGVNNALAEQLSSRLGEKTIVVGSGGTSSGYSHSRSMGGMQDSVSRSETVNRNWSLLGRRLLKPEEILSMGERIALTFVPGVRPIRTYLERYYEKSSKRRKQSLKKQIYGEAVCFLIVTSFVLFLAAKLEECVRHGRIHHATNRSFLPRNL